MAANTIANTFTTISVSTTGDSIATRGHYCWLKNMGANVVSVTETSTNPTGAVTAGTQASLNPAPASGVPDTFQLRPNTTYLVRAAVAATLVCVDEFETPPKAA